MSNKHRKLKPNHYHGSDEFRFWERWSWLYPHLKVPVEAPRKRQEEHAGDRTGVGSGSGTDERTEALMSPEPMYDQEMLRRIHESDSFTFENVCKAFGVKAKD